jgi:hypothetical protein
MDVAVHFKPGQRWLQSARTPSVLGSGLLERARSTTLALLGMTTAVGLAMVALVLNQSWPLLADSPIPAAPARQEAIGKATVATSATPDASRSGRSPAAHATRSDSPRVASRGDGSGARAPQVDSMPSAELVVAPSAPAEPQGDAAAGAGKPSPSTPPAGKAPQAPASPVSAPVRPEPAPPQPPPSPPLAEPPPPATASGAPVESSVPPWSNGKGHAYGREKSSSGAYDE